MPYDERYRTSPDYFGCDPSDLLTAHFHLLDKSRPVLDLGAGQGRNAFYLAREGFAVDAVEPSAVAVEQMSRIVTAERLPVHLHPCGFEAFTPAAEGFGAVLIFGLIQILSPEKILLLLEKMHSWTSSGSLIFVTAFTTSDPSFVKNAAEHEKVGKNSFRSDSGGFFTYLEPNEIITLFAGFETLHHDESLGSPHRHGNRPSHQHAQANAIFRRL